MPSSWPASRLLPALQVLAEGSWLAVVYAALQAIVGQEPWVGPVELAVATWAGMAWARRRRWLSAGWEALGLPLLALAAGAVGWLLDPQVRLLLIEGRALEAMATHGPGWLAAVAFWRGELHRSTDDDDQIQDQLLRWAIPGLAVPWALGHALASGAIEQAFVAAAFVGTVFFIGSAFTAMGLARLEAVRQSTGSDWRKNRSWLVLVVGMALGLTLVAIPAGAFLGVPARSLLVALLGPLQTVIIALVILATPLILIGAALADLIRPILPEGFGLGQIRLPSLAGNQRDVGSDLPTVFFFVIVGALILLEAAVLAVIIWMRWQERQRMRAAQVDAFEERSIVVPDFETPPPPSLAPPPRRRLDPNDPAEAYLAALDALERDARWARLPAETPAAHAARARSDGLPGSPLSRLASAYQLLRYAGARLTPREAGRAGTRLAELRRLLRRS